MSIQLRDGFINESQDRVLEDLLVRFVVNCPPEDLSSIERVFFQIEEAQWFYTDFVRQLNPQLKNLSMKTFSQKIIEKCPLIWRWGNPEDALVRFGKYKSTIPVRGCALFNSDYTKLLLVQGYQSKSWGFPRGKISKAESDLTCALRELKEETGFDASNYIDENEYIERTIKGKNYRIYLVSDVPEDTPFEPLVRNEISDIQWKDVKKLSVACKNSNKLFLVDAMIKPILNFIKRKTSSEDYLKQKATFELSSLLGIGEEEETADYGRELMNIIQQMVLKDKSQSSAPQKEIPSEQYPHPQQNFSNISNSNVNNSVPIPVFPNFPFIQNLPPQQIPAFMNGQLPPLPFLAQPFPYIPGGIPPTAMFPPTMPQQQQQQPNGPPFIPQDTGPRPETLNRPTFYRSKEADASQLLDILRNPAPSSAPPSATQTESKNSAELLSILKQPNSNTANLTENTMEQFNKDVNSTPKEQSEILLKYLNESSTDRNSVPARAPSTPPTTGATSSKNRIRILKRGTALDELSTRTVEQDSNIDESFMKEISFNSDNRQSDNSSTSSKTIPRIAPSKRGTDVPESTFLNGPSVPQVTQLEKDNDDDEFGDFNELHEQHYSENDSQIDLYEGLDSDMEEYVPPPKPQAAPVVPSISASKNAIQPSDVNKFKKPKEKKQTQAQVAVEPVKARKKITILKKGDSLEELLRRSNEGTPEPQSLIPTEPSADLDATKDLNNILFQTFPSNENQSVEPPKEQPLKSNPTRQSNGNSASQLGLLGLVKQNTALNGNSSELLDMLKRPMFREESPAKSNGSSELLDILQRKEPSNPPAETPAPAKNSSELLSILKSPDQPQKSDGSSELLRVLKGNVQDKPEPVNNEIQKETSNGSSELLGILKGNTSNSAELLGMLKGGSSSVSQ
ncbi:BA75_03118T0 [Komagataella pastoris]|uniref:BA75_03118T0 n=1 Tax=Komagataella pastoris TaxID=4922 RepID=A0A1B2JDP6_PICPA|nr:BA75_03118T0 [Komagataella pastoris]